MNLQEFKNIVESSKDKYKVFTDSKIIESIDFNYDELTELIKANLNNDEIMLLFYYKYYQQLPDTIRKKLMDVIELPDGLMTVLSFLQNKEFVKVLISDKAFIDKNIKPEEIPILCKNIEDADDLEKVIQWYSDNREIKIEIFKNVYDDNKKIALLSDENDFTESEKLDILLSIENEKKYCGIFT